MLWLLLQQIRNGLEILANAVRVKANTSTNTNANFFILFLLGFLYFQLVNLQRKSII